MTTRGLIVVLLAGTVCAPAYAQTTSAPASSPAEPTASESNGLEDIVVTAQRRSENLQNVPISITAVTQEMLGASQVNGMLQLQKSVPGLITNRTGASLQPFIRGVGTNQTVQGSENSVAIYIDGIYQGFKAGNLFEFNDIERIEVLKGPQGTLFGRNATAGAISIVTRDPSRDQGVQAEIGYGNLNEFRAKAYAATDIFKDLAVSISYTGRRNDGYIDDSFRHLKNVAPYRSQAVTSKLKWTPADGFVSTLSAGYSTLVDGTATAFHVLPGTTPTAAGLGQPYTTDDDLTSTSVPQQINDTANSRVTWDNRYILGQLDLVSISGYVHNKIRNLTDIDASLANLGLIVTNQYSDTYSQEFQIQSNNGKRLKWIIGAYYLNLNDYYGERPDNNWSTQLNVPNPVRPADLQLPGARIIGRSTGIRTTSYSAFAEGKYELLASTRVTAGLRYTTDKKALTGTQYLYTAVAGSVDQNVGLRNGVLGNDGLVFGRTTNSTVDLSTTFSKITWRLVLDHDFAEGVMGYASASRGFKSGNLNPSLVTNNQVPVRPETVTAYEVGIKSELFNRRVRFNAAAFYNDFTDIQVALVTSTGGSITQNAGASRAYGVDVELTAMPTRNLTLRAAAEYLNSKYTSYDNAALNLPRVSGFTCAPGAQLSFTRAREIASLPQTGGNCSVLALDGKGLRTIFSPKLTLNLSGNYDYELNGGSTLNLSTGLYYNSGYDFAPGGLFAHSGSFHSLAASVGWTTANKRFYARVWGDNITGKRYPRTILPLPFAYATVTSQPVTFGVLVGTKF